MNYKETMASLNLNEDELSINGKNKIKKLARLESDLNALTSTLADIPEEEKEEQQKLIQKISDEIAELDRKLSRSFHLWVKNKDKYIAIGKNIHAKKTDAPADNQEIEEEENEYNEQEAVVEKPKEVVANKKPVASSKIDELYVQKNKKQKYEEEDLDKDEEYEESNKPLTKPKKKNNKGNYALLGIGLFIFSFGMYNIWQNRK
jgi:hypothetical protein